MTRVLLTDDDPLVRAGLGLILGGAPGIEVVAEASDGREAVATVRERPVDLVLMDLRMPVMDGIEATRVITTEPSPPKVVVLTTFDADDHIVRALAAGAAGFLLKDTPPPRIVQAIEAVMAGEPILSPAVTANLIRQVTADGADQRRTAAERLVATLTERELDVAHAVGQGRSNAEIAAELFMSLATVKAHISRIFAKLDASNRVQVAITMHDAGRL
ncbi:response regulator transcription factor [Aeromicrobium tamlense]|uniref:DNA-binding NarL/FixJ family response regulator n=1 Tax=Aeromicrobium tamlense TaxID=375541 RepID=A0ABX2SKW9_9ACTN|nr:response regulator transcription factor [Aeromicrobium tamlense]NYI38438.1 DNA-binding NarL/FixJ family response regulator [Aeromicrobium tamlense]